MFISIAAFRAFLEVVRERLVNAIRAGWHIGRPGARYTWDTLTMHLRAAFWQAVMHSIDDVAAAAKEAIARMLQGPPPATR